MKNEELARYHAIRKVLLNVWDPLNVGDNPHLADEYDEFILPILKQLRGHPTVEDIAQQLRSFEVGLGDIDRSEFRIRQAAKALSEL